MFKIVFKIWCVANLMVALVFTIALSREGLRGLATVQLYSCLLSLPAAIILYSALLLIKRVHNGTTTSWIVMIIATALAAYSAFYLFNISFKELTADLNFILPLSFITGFSAVLLYSPSLHYLFVKFYYEN